MKNIINYTVFFIFIIIINSCINAQRNIEPINKYNVIYKKELAGEDISIAINKRNTTNYISSMYKTFAKSKIDSSYIIAKKISLLSYEYITLSNSLKLFEIKPYDTLPSDMQKIYKCIADSIEECFKRDEDLVRCLITRTSTNYFVIGREINPGLHATLGWENEPNGPYLGIIGDVDPNTFEIGEGKYVINITVPIFVNDKYFADITLYYYK